jgi:hypothetical protein
MSNYFVDPVVEETHAIRAAMLETAGGDVHALMQQVAERQEHSQRRVIREPFRRRRDAADARQELVPERE